MSSIERFASAFCIVSDQIFSFIRITADDPSHYNLEERARVSHVTEYYEYYVQKKNLQDNFINGCLVTSVEKLAVHPMVCRMVFLSQLGECARIL